MAVAANQKIITKEEWEQMRLDLEFSKVVPRQKGSDWQGLVFKPSNVYFATQNHGEQIFILLRKHFVTNFNWILNTAIWAVIPFAVDFGFAFFGYELLELFEIKLVTVLLLTFYAVLLTNITRNFADWYFNLYIVTNERVVDYDYKAFVSRGVSESTLSGIEDVKENSIGFLPSLFNYGDVSMYSAADKNVIVFNDVPNPTVVRDKVADLAKIAKKQLND